MQDEAECLFFLADLHALTVSVDPEQLRSNNREMAAALIASGIDPAKAILFQQSAIPAHPELAWILQCTARMGWLERMTQFKEKSGQHKERSSVGLFTYPVLQAADVLLYRTTHVPVGEDQKQHLELARDIALKFNNDFDVELFVPPEPFIGGGTAARVMSLRDGKAKMSKSDPSEMSRIQLTDSDDQITQKIRKAKTDPEPLPEDPALLDGRPEAKNLVGIYAAITDESIEQVLERFAGQGFGAFKPALADAVVALMQPLRTRLEQLRNDPAELDRILGRRLGTGCGDGCACSEAGLCGGRPAALTARFIDSSARAAYKAHNPKGFRELRCIMRLQKLAAAALLGVAAVGISGCATSLPTKVTRYSVAIPQGQSFYVVPANGIQTGLEFNRYAALVSQQMAARGYVQAASTAAADMLIKVGYGVDEGTKEYSVDPFARSRYYSPFYRGFYDPFYGGYFGRPYYSRYGYYGYRSPFYWGWDDPFWYNSPYSGFGADPIRDYTVYKSQLDLDIVRRVDNAPLFDGKAVARSQTDELGTLVPNLIEAMFTNFPGENGKTVKITVPGRKKA